MPDEWSSSVVTFATAGDWAKWTFNVPDATAAANLNGASAGLLENFLVRGGMSGASQTRVGILIINDLYFKNMGGDTPSTAGWISADRFQLTDFYNTQGFSVAGLAGGGTVSIPLAEPGPFVVGTNTLRYMAFGASAGHQLDVILMAYGTNDGLAYNFGNDTTAETKPADYDTHVNPNPINSGTRPTYLLKGNEATTGTAESRPLELRKFCQVGSNYLVTVHIENAAGAAATGTAGTDYGSGATMQTTTLDANGDVTFLVIGNTKFWYGGSDTVGPATLVLNYATQAPVNCGGWAVGAVGMSQ